MVILLYRKQNQLFLLTKVAQEAEITKISKVIKSKQLTNWLNLSLQQKSQTKHLFLWADSVKLGGGQGQWEAWEVIKRPVSANESPQNKFYGEGTTNNKATDIVATTKQTLWAKKQQSHKYNYSNQGINQSLDLSHVHAKPS